MKKGTFYAVGIGPGDPELITIKAARVMAACPVIAAVKTRSGANLAYDIAAHVVDFTEKTVLPLSFPMPRNGAGREHNHITAARAVIACLESGLDVALPNLGDVAIYSSASYILGLVRKAGYSAEMIPGVTSFCAAAAALKTSLTAMEKPLHIIPVCHGDLDAALGLGGNKVLMKTGSSIAAIRRALRERDLLDKASLVENCGLEDERVCPSLANIGDETGYFTTIIVKE